MHAKRQLRDRRAVTALVALVALLLAACGGDGATGGDAASGEPPEHLDVWDDGTVQVGLVVAGDQRDEGFYQGQVEALREVAEEFGFEAIVVDRVAPGAAQETFENLARQRADLVIAGGAELMEGFVPVATSEEFSHMMWVLNAPFPPDSDAYVTVRTDENEAHFMGGVAMALVLERTGGDIASIVAGPELDFVRNTVTALRAGLQHHNPDAELLVTYTGDFEDASLAREAAVAQIARGSEVVYPYLGGALGAVLQAAEESGIGPVAVSVDRCDDADREYAAAIVYNAGLYFRDVIQAWVDGELQKGELFALYGVGDGIGVGATVCDAGDAEQQVLDEVADAIASGEIDVLERMAEHGE